MDVVARPLPGVLLLAPRLHADARGFFVEAFRAPAYAELGVAGPFVQDNLTRSRRGALRGLHYRVGTPQGKLVFAVRGACFDVAVDLRAGSPTFGRWFGTVLSDDNHHQMWIPPGCAHGFLALSEAADVVFKLTAVHDAEAERAVRWDDPAIGIPWPDVGPPILSPRDAAAPLLAEAERA